MIKIGIDGNEANVAEQVGVSVYTINLLRYFQTQASEEVQFVVYLRHKPLEHLPPATKHFRYQVVSGKAFWSQVFLPIHLFLHRGIQVFFAPAHYSPRYIPAPLVVTIHDLSYVYYPNDFLKQDLFKLKEWTKISVAKAAQIIAVSKTTKKDIMKVYETPEQKIEVIYNGFEKRVSRHENTEILAGYGLEKGNYILYVGTLQARKNIPTLIRGYAKLREKYPEMKLVIAGKKGWLYDEIFDTVKNLDLEQQVIFTGYVPDDELGWLYSHAFCFALPSLYEGFGIPILEAMAAGCPVVTSYAASLSEIGGEACLYFDPHSVEDVYFNLKLLKEDPKTRSDLIEKGYERVKQFSWTDCAQKTLAVLKSAAKQ